MCTVFVQVKMLNIQVPLDPWNFRSLWRNTESVWTSLILTKSLLLETIVKQLQVGIFM